MTPTSELAQAVLKARMSSSSVRARKALYRSGLLIVIQARPLSTSYVMSVNSVIACLSSLKAPGTIRPNVMVLPYYQTGPGWRNTRLTQPHLTSTRNQSAFAPGHRSTAADHRARRLGLPDQPRFRLLELVRPEARGGAPSSMRCQTFPPTPIPR